eukprot:gb/GECG01014580.1/.p1 GENE.gb/GECG01014580.1/~~gb/GECG01014580.1/.p1  ORF type:complete len:232 (+),score=22.54 gb/GECG01014580.1/:1-696(+)
MIPGLSTSKPAKPAVKRKTFGTNRLAPGAILPSKKELITGEKPSNADQSTTSSDGESNSASNGTSGVASGKKHGLENGVKGKAKKQKTVDYEEEQLETPDKGRFTFAVVCACNMNRSMAAHKAMQEQGYKVQSFGTARQVCCRYNITLGLYDDGRKSYPPKSMNNYICSNTTQQVKIKSKDMISMSNQISKIVIGGCLFAIGGLSFRIVFSVFYSLNSTTEIVLCRDVGPL